MIIRFPIERTRAPDDRRRLSIAEVDRCAAEMGLQHSDKLKRYIRMRDFITSLEKEKC